MVRVPDSRVGRASRVTVLDFKIKALERKIGDLLDRRDALREELFAAQQAQRENGEPVTDAASLR